MGLERNAEPLGTRIDAAQAFIEGEQGRMFAPLGGVLEDPATGSACAALGALLTAMAPGENVDLHYEIEQGDEMGRPSLLIASGRKTAEGPVEATVAGSCVPAARGTLEV